MKNQKIKQFEKQSGHKYLGISSEFIWNRSKTIPSEFSTDQLQSHYLTNERSVDTHQISDLLTSCALNHERIEIRTYTTISHISKENQKWKIKWTESTGRPCFGVFDVIINAAWDGRLQLDEQVFGSDNRTWFHRYKTCLNIQTNGSIKLPNFTAIIGSYGDIVSFPSGRVYCSWYPTGMLSHSPDIKRLKTVFDKETKQHVAEATLRGLKSFLPELEQKLGDYQPSAHDISGGVIMAHGETDIDDCKSILHQRHQIGSRHYQGYFSIDTGKYCAGPAFAEEIANIIIRS